MSMPHSNAHQVMAHRLFRGRANNLYWELRLGVTTRGIVDVRHPDSGHYATVGYSTVWRILDHLAIEPSDTFVDIGCGKGRILCCAARYPCQRVIGVDLSPDLCAQARVNAVRVRGRKSPVLVHEGGADAFDYGDATVCYLFSPFGAATLDLVLDKIRRDSDGRSVRLAFQNLNEAQEAVFAEHPWLDRYAYWDPQTYHTQHNVAFYRSQLSGGR